MYYSIKGVPCPAITSIITKSGLGVSLKGAKLDTLYKDVVVVVVGCGITKLLLLLLNIVVGLTPVTRKVLSCVNCQSTGSPLSLSSLGTAMRERTTPPSPCNSHLLPLSPQIFAPLSLGSLCSNGYSISISSTNWGLKISHFPYNPTFPTPHP